MNDIFAETPEIVAEKGWPDYRAVWRWHFYASLFCIPFVVVLSISGAIYLFKEEIEGWQDRPYDHLAISGESASTADQIRAALAAIPDSSLDGYELPKADNAASRVLLQQQGEIVRVYLHPETLQVLHYERESDRFMPFIRLLHGELLSGERGSMVVELAASWTIIMIVTGLYLWWPRGARALAGVVYPRLRGGSRIFWRDFHAVTGVWISAFALFLLLSGLPWAKSWGNYLKTVRRVTGTAALKQEWSIGGRQGDAPRGETEMSSQSHGEHGHGRSGGRRRAKSSSPSDLSPVDRIVATIRPLRLSSPVVISPPQQGSANWVVKSLTANRPNRVTLNVDGATGKVVSREDFRNRQWIDRIVAIGIAAHEGRLFGWPNQAIGLLTAIGLDMLCLSGLVLWWKRRDQGVLGAPNPGRKPSLSLGLIALVLGLGIYLPLFGMSLLLMLVLEKAILSRIPTVRDWLGLCGPRPDACG